MSYLLHSSSSMDPVLEIKARLPIDQLVSQYCQLEKKGSQMKCICPFHNDKHPSMLVSPDKGIAYCFACQSGGDIFSFYQKIEGVDFKQALKDLADKAGVKIADMPSSGVGKDHKDRLHECLTAAHGLYKSRLKDHAAAKDYLKKRGIPTEQVERFELGVAPDSFSETYEHLLKAGFSKSEITDAGLVIQKDIKTGKMYDRFRNRLMFPIHDTRGRLVGFGGRTLGDDDAKYINSSDGPLYHKSSVLFGYHMAKDSMRDSKHVVMVEGYFDVLACHRVGIENVVAVSGTALTSQHVSILNRTCETVTLCLDQDRAGREAAEKAFMLCSKEGMLVRFATLDQKDPDEALQADPEAFKRSVVDDAEPYLDVILREWSEKDLAAVANKREALKAVLPLVNSLSTAMEQTHYLEAFAAMLGTTQTALQEDLAQLKRKETPPMQVPARSPAPETQEKKEPGTEYSRLQIALALMVTYNQRDHLESLIEPQEGFEKAVYLSLKDAPEVDDLTADMLTLEDDDREKLSILLLYCEHHGMNEWAPVLAEQEIRKNIQQANRDILKRKQKNIAKQLIMARRDGKRGEEERLNTQYQEVLKLLKMAKG